VSGDRALLHAARVSFSAAALVEEMLSEAGVLHARDLTDLMLRLDEIIMEARLARAELGRGRRALGRAQGSDSTGRNALPPSG
jgi:hypothetical protein